MSETGWAVDDAELLAPFFSQEAKTHLGDPPLRSRKEKQARKGLPADENLRKLAEVWLSESRKLWPQLAERGLLPPLTGAAIDELVAQFKQRFIRAELDRFVASNAFTICKALAAAYLRYSDDNSNPRSLDDQLLKALRRAHGEGRFIPWEYVFADASVTGRTHLRRSYRLAKEAMERFKDSGGPDTLYFDDFGRATRGAIESYRLAKLMERLRRRLIGVSDGFDLDSPAAKIQVAAAAMFNEWFIDQLRAKVLRGMKGAAERGTSTGNPRFGYRLVPKLDAAGKPVMNEGKGTVINELEIDPEVMQHVLRAARWLGEEHRSYKEIARRFNADAVGGHHHWQGSQISKMLACPLYIGVRIYNRTRTVFDSETGEISFEPNPRSEWIIKIMPKLKAWEDELWKKVRRRAAAVRRGAPRTGQPYRPRELHPHTLLDETLICGCCGRAMVLIRSDGLYRQYGCPNGTGKVNGCTLFSSKSVRTVETAVLRFVTNRILTPEVIRSLVVQANAHLAELAKRPRRPVEPLKRQLRKLTDEERKIVDLVLSQKAEHDMTAFLKRSDDLRKQIANVQTQLREADAANAEAPAPLDEAKVVGYLTDIRGLLNQNVERAAPLLRQLTGHIVVRERREPGRKRAEWIGEITCNVAAFMAAAAGRLQLPVAEALGTLGRSEQPASQKVTLQLSHWHKYEELAENGEFLSLVHAGRNPSQISKALNLSYALVCDAVRFLKTGERPKPEPPRKSKPRRRLEGPKLPPKYLRHASEVGRLRDQEHKNFPEIAATLGVGVGTVERAYTVYLGKQAAAVAGGS